MNHKGKLFGVIAALAILAGCSPTPMHQAIYDMGLLPNQLPMASIPIGSVVLATYDWRGNLTDWPPVCTPDDRYPDTARLHEMVKTHSTEELTEIVNRSNDNKISVDASKIKDINAKLSAHNMEIKQIYLRITNAKILDTSLANLYEITNTMAASNPYCYDAIKDPNDNRKREGLMRELVADVDYSIDTKSGEDFRADANFRNIISAALDVEWDDAEQEFRAGRQLVYGIKLEPVKLNDATIRPTRAAGGVRPDS